jgi:hypothetical protein
MALKSKPAPAPRGTTPSSFLSLISGWVQQGVESLFATQRVLVDVAMRQNAIMMKSVRDVLSDPESSPAAIFTELAVEGTSSFIEVQRILLNLAQEQNDLIMNGVKDRVGGSTVAMATTETLRRSIDTFLQMQQDFLRTTKKQTINWLESIKSGKGIQNVEMLDLAGEAMDSFVEAQKKFLDIISQETARATSGKPYPHVSKKTELRTLARDGVTAFIEAQKKLLDVAGQQMTINLNAASKTISMLSPARLIPMANLTGEGVKGFVEAEKALIDTIAKPRNGAKMPPRPRRRKAAKRRKTPLAQAAAAD